MGTHKKAKSNNSHNVGIDKERGEDVIFILGDIFVGFDIESKEKKADDFKNQERNDEYSPISNVLDAFWLGSFI